MNLKVIFYNSLFLTLTSVAYAKYPNIYPFVPADDQVIHKTVKRVSEDTSPILNMKDAAKYSSAKSKKQPWSSSFWPLNQGLIASNYESTRIGYYLDRGFFSWTKNYNTFLARKNGVLKNIESLTQGQLNTLAPSEKYDILMGDSSFDLTNRLWDYTYKWGTKKENAFISNLNITGGKSLERANEILKTDMADTYTDALSIAINQVGGLAESIAANLVESNQYQSFEDALQEGIRQAGLEKDNYVLVKKNKYIALWEGICHGWSTAAGVVPRPTRTVKFDLPNGKKLKFYPDDIKGLISLLWANSTIQDGKWIDEKTGKNFGGGVISAGLRCNLKNPKKDRWGRVYDDRPDPFSGSHDPRCVGVHPATWHLALVNIIGKQGRSFIVERKISDEVDNHPMSSYKMRYYNPNTGRFKNNFMDAITTINKDDQFEEFRSPKAKYILGVLTTMTYIDYRKPTRYFNDSPANDDTKDIKMYYDLELDEEYNIIGGQWRAKKTGVAREFQGRPGSPGRRLNRPNHNQPDFFWVITKDWKNYFQAEELEPWTNTTKLPPKSWKEKALKAHSFVYQKTHNFNWYEKCSVANKETGNTVKVPCEFKTNQPQPLLNVVNKLIELSK